MVNLFIYLQDTKNLGKIIDYIHHQIMTMLKISSQNNKVHNGIFSIPEL